MMNDKQFWTIKEEVKLGDFILSPEDFEVDQMKYKTGRGRRKTSPVERKLFPRKLYD
jgi:hypothetical protein